VGKPLPDTTCGQATPHNEPPSPLVLSGDDLRAPAVGWMQRKIIPELLDGDQGTPDEIRTSLNDLRHINNWFGGTRTTAALLRRVADEVHGKELSLLEIGAGSGVVALGARRMLERAGLRLQVTLLDRMWSHLPLGQSSVCGDALRLPFRDDAFDVVSCSLFAHHFERQELRQLASESLRVCRRALLINDLIRSRLHLWLVYAGLPLFRSRITWHDAPASVSRAYTPPEMREMLQDLSAKQITISRHYLYRMGVVVWK
jgi:ubiquinone/menaquinone biosynthesis C-methylase UbiE